MTEARSAREGRGRTLRVVAACALLPVVLRCVFECVNSAAGTSLPVMNDRWLTVLFSTFSLSHAASVLGWRRAGVFLAVCVGVSWLFEAVGVRTGLVYGHYHYSAMLGAKVGGVPVLIPFAWFMMVYASWTVSHVLLEGVGSAGAVGGMVLRSGVAAVVMTMWDVIMDPQKSADGNWTWEEPGMYFGVPVHNFVGWLVTTGTIYVVAGLLFRVVRRGAGAGMVGRGYLSLPVVAYVAVAMARAFIAEPLPLRVFAAFSMCFVGWLALVRVLGVRGTPSLP